MWISPSYQDTDFPPPHSIDTKITLFEDRAFGWKLNIADEIINGSKSHAPVQHAEYATLDIVFSYFEMIGKYQDGFAKLGDSEKYFKLGVYSIFPEYAQPKLPTSGLGLSGKGMTLFDKALEVMYDGIRCGLYHSGITNGRVVVTGAIETALAFDPSTFELVINPRILVVKLKSHFLDYISRLKDPKNASLRAKFEARYNFDTQS